jgi:hypothetical protein
MSLSGHAQYEIVAEQSTAEVLVIRDLGPWDMHPTVTNDVDHVVRELYRRGDLADGRRLWYWDSDGVLDEIVHRHGAFQSFQFIASGRSATK